MYKLEKRNDVMMLRSPWPPLLYLLAAPESLVHLCFDFSLLNKAFSELHNVSYPKNKSNVLLTAVLKKSHKFFPNVLSPSLIRKV